MSLVPTGIHGEMVQPSPPGMCRIASGRPLRGYPGSNFLDLWNHLKFLLWPWTRSQSTDYDGTVARTTQYTRAQALDSGSSDHRSPPTTDARATPGVVLSGLDSGTIDVTPGQQPKTSNSLADKCSRSATDHQGATRNLYSVGVRNKVWPTVGHIRIIFRAEQM